MRTFRQSHFSILDKVYWAFVILMAILLLHPVYLILVRNAAYLALVSNLQGMPIDIPCNSGSADSAPKYSDFDQVSYALNTIDSISARWLMFRINSLNGYLDTESLIFLRNSDYTRAITVGPSLIRKIVDGCLASKNAKSAESMIKNSESIGFADPMLFEKLAELYVNQKKWLDAVDTYRHIIDLNPEWTAHYFVKIGEIYLWTGDLEKAETFFKNALAKGSEFSSWKQDYEEIYANFSLGEVYRMRGLKGEAVYYYEKVVTNDDGPWLGYAAWVHLGEYQATEGLYHQAVESFINAVNCNPKTAWPHVSLGNLFGKLGDKAKAAEQYQIAESIDPTVIDFDKAIKDLENLP